MSGKLTARQRAFVNAYVKHGVAMRAAIEAGYTEITARSSSKRLLENAGIKDEIRRLSAVAEAKTIADLSELREMWSRTLRDEECRVSDRLRASELMGKSLGAFIDKVEHSVNGELAALLKARRERARGAGAGGQ